MPRRITDVERARAVAIGKRMHESAKQRMGNVRGFHAALLAAGARGVSSPKDLYAKFSGKSIVSPELIRVAADVLDRRPHWLETGLGDRKLLDTALRAEHETLSRFEQEVFEAFKEHFRVATAATVARSIVETRWQVFDLLDAESRATVLSQVAELASVAAHLRTTDQMVHLTRSMIEMAVCHAQAVGAVARRTRTVDRATRSSWKILWITIRDAALADSSETSRLKFHKPTRGVKRAQNANKPKQRK